MRRTSPATDATERNTTVTRRIIVITMVCCLTGGCAALHTATPSETKAQAHEHWDQVRGELKLQLARQHFAAHRFTDAEKVAMEALSYDPSLTDGYALLAKVALELGKPMTAERTLETARNLKLDSPELTYMWGVVLEQRGETEAACASYQRACEADPTKVDYLMAYAEALVALGRTKEAAAKLDAARGNYDDDTSVELLAAHVDMLLGNTTGAIQSFRKALEGDGDNVVAARELGLLLAREGRYEEATTWLSRALPGDGKPNSADDSLRLPLAEAYLETHHPYQAKETLRPVLRDELQDRRVFATYAKAALALHDYADALDVTKRGLVFAPHNAQLTLLRATALWRSAETRSAEQLLLGLRTREPDNTTAICLLAEVMRSSGRRDRADALFRRALELEPDNAWARQGLDALQ